MQQKKLSSSNYGYVFLSTEREVENFLVLAEASAITIIGCLNEKQVLEDMA